MGQQRKLKCPKKHQHHFTNQVGTEEYSWKLCFGVQGVERRTEGSAFWGLRHLVTKDTHVGEEQGKISQAVQIKEGGEARSTA